MENKQLYEKQSNQYNPFFPIVRLDDIIETISDKSIQWILNNYNHIYVEYSESVVITRNKVPSLLRRNGLWISYNTGKDIITEWYKGKNVNINDYNQWTDDANWDKFEPLADGKVTYQHLSHALKQLMGKGNNITNFPDEEDITSDGTVLSFKDREYDTNNFSGLGKIILRKNIVLDNGVYKNVLTQDMINKSNTIYEIRYDFDLNGAEITIPEGCVLDFQGGSFSNGIIVGNNTNIKANNISIFNSIQIQGIWKVTNIYSSWFKDIYSNNVLKELFNLSNADILNNIYINKGEYIVSALESDNEILKVKSNTNLYIEGDVILEPNNLGIYSIISIVKAENVFISGSGTIVGDKDSHLGTTGEWGDGIDISGSKDVVISGLTVHNCWGDCIYIGGWNGINENIVIKDFHLYNGRRQGISVTWGNNITIKDGKINDILGTEPYACIDLEPNTGCVVSNIDISNVKMNSSKGVLIVPGGDVYDSPNTNTRDIKISNCEIEGDYLLLIGTSYNVKIEDTRFISTREGDYAIHVAGHYLDKTPYLFKRCHFNVPNKILFKETNSHIKVIESTIIANTLNSVDYQNKILNEFIKCQITLVKDINTDYILVEGCNIYGGGRIFTGRSYIINNNKIKRKDEGLTIDSLLFLQGNCVVDGNEFIINGSITNRAIISINSGINTIINNIATVMYPDEWSTYSAFIGGTLDGCKISNNKVSDITKRIFNSDITKVLFGPEYERKSGSTDNRPTTNLLSGQNYFDTTLNKPIWWTGTKWVDATGADV